jgi:16S rRNA G966 N2-methylase RsmD
VRRFIRVFERAFFIDEDSDREEELKQITNVVKHEEALQVFRETCHIKQFWCVPISTDIRGFDFKKLFESQLKNSGGRLFDVITVDPPW